MFVRFSAAAGHIDLRQTCKEGLGEEKQRRDALAGELHFVRERFRVLDAVIFGRPRNDVPLATRSWSDLRSLAPRPRRFLNIESMLRMHLF
jgi:hypothetical protein